VITVGPSDSLLTGLQANARQRRVALPVVDQSGRVVGISDESDILVKVHRDSTPFNDSVNNAMTDKLETLPPTAKINDLLGVFDQRRVKIVDGWRQMLGTDLPGRISFAI